MAAYSCTYHQLKYSSPNRTTSNPPFQFVVGPCREGGALEDLPHLLPAEAEVVDGPDVGELDHLHLHTVTSQSVTGMSFNGCARQNTAVVTLHTKPGFIRQTKPAFITHQVL